MRMLSLPLIISGMPECISSAVYGMVRIALTGVTAVTVNNLPFMPGNKPFECPGADGGIEPPLTGCARMYF